MNARRLGALAAIATLVAAGGYFFVYLYRWEWNRAQVSAAIFLAAEVAVVAWLLADRLGKVERRLDRFDADRRSVEPEARLQQRLQLIRTNAPAPRSSFAWMTRTDRTSVFIPVLLGAGAVLSGLAWLVERISRSTAGRVAERGLARQLGTLEAPTGGLLDVPPDPLALLRGPGR